MNDIKFALCILDDDDNIINKRILTLNFKKNIKENLKQFYNINVEDEIPNIVSYIIKESINEHLIKELMRGE